MSGDTSCLTDGALLIKSLSVGCLLEQVAKLCGSHPHGSSCGLYLTRLPQSQRDLVLTFKYLSSLSWGAVQPSTPSSLTLKVPAPGTDLDLV